MSAALDGGLANHAAEEEPRYPSQSLGGHAEKHRVDRRKDEILDALAQGRLEDAERATHALSRAQAESGRADLATKSLCDLAKRSARMGHVGYAERCLRAAMAQTPDDPITWTQLVSLMRTLRRPDEQLVWSERMIARFPDSDVALSAHAATLRAAGRLEEAVALYDRAVARAPSNVHARNGRAALLRRLGMFQQAEAAYAETRARFPDDDFAWNGLGGMLRARGELTQAHALFAEARARFPDNALAHLRGAEALLALDRLDDALALHDEAAARFPDDFALSRGRARTLGAMGLRREALVEADRLPRSSPRALGLRVTRAEVLKDRGDLAPALRVFQAIFRGGELDALGRIGLGFTAMRLGDLRSARQAYASPGWDLTRPPRSASEWAFASARGLLALRANEHARAEAIFQRGTTSPFVDHSVRAHHMRALSALLRKDFTGARAALEGLPSVESATIRVTSGVLHGLARGDQSAVERALGSTRLAYWPLRALRKPSRRLTLDGAPGDLRDLLLELVHL